MRSNPSATILFTAIYTRIIKAILIKFRINKTLILVQMYVHNNSTQGIVVLFLIRLYKTSKSNSLYLFKVKKVPAMFIDKLLKILKTGMIFN
jgi:hypothetical protein